MRWKNAAPHRRIAAMVLFGSLVANATADSFQSGNDLAWVHIDGHKNPELIPEWSAWQDVFSTIAGGRKLLPTAVLDQVTKAQAELILRESEASVSRAADCDGRILALKAGPTKSTQQAFVARTREIRLECRWANLHARDRVMAALSPEGRAAMNDFVDLMKAGTRFTVAKSELQFFRQPQ